MSIIEAKHSWSGTAGLASGSQLINHTIVRQVSAPSQSTASATSRITVFFSAKPTENLHHTETVRTSTSGKRAGAATKKRKSKSK